VIGARALLEDIVARVPAKVGWPDDDVDLRVADPAELRAAFAECLTKFREYWPNTTTVIDIAVNTYHWKLDVRVKQLAVEPERQSTSSFPEALQTAFTALDRAVGADGKTYCWSTCVYFGMMLPIEVPAGAREDFPKLDTADWDELYRRELERASWRHLRAKAFRFCNHAVELARALHGRAATIAVPSVGLCAHPWIFAEAGLRAIATDISATALAIVAQPERWPRIYGSAAQLRWHIDQTCLHAGVVQPGAFPRMAAIERADVAAELRSRIAFARADWTALPIDAHAVDAMFATNALPRDNEALARVAVEWQRVLKLTGHLFLAMHGAGGLDIAATFERLGWTATDAVDAEPTKLTYQPYFSSG
jgi:hypothetical protein